MTDKNFMGNLNPPVLCESMTWHYLFILEFMVSHLCSIIVAASDDNDHLCQDSNYGQHVTIIAPVSVNHHTFMVLSFHNNCSN